MATKTNIVNHVSDNAEYVKIEKNENTPPGIENVQQLIESLAPHAYKIPGLPGAELNSPGVIGIASEEDTMAGVDNSTAITPYLLKYRLDRPEATETVLGVVRYSTNAEALAGSLKNRSITPSNLKHVLDTRKSTESIQGTIKISTEAAAKLGTDDTTSMTPKKVALAISVLSPVEGLATEKSKGVVFIATQAQTQEGVSREGLAVSPYALMNTKATSSKWGITKLSSSSEFTSISDSTAVSPKTLHDNKASSTVFGIVKLSGVHTTDPNIALSASAGVVYKTGGDTTGRITLNGKKYITEDEITGGLDVGMITFSAMAPKAGSSYIICDGRSLDKIKEPVLFQAIGYTYGGSGNNFNIPDMRGLFVKGVGKGSKINGELGDDIEPTILGQVQAQQVRKHKHVGPWGVDRNDDSFGKTSSWNKCGSGRHDYNNPLYFTNDGTAWNGNPNPDGIIGNENRPWNISLYYVIKAR